MPECSINKEERQRAKTTYILVKVKPPNTKGQNQTQKYKWMQTKIDAIMNRMS